MIEKRMLADMAVVGSLISVRVRPGARRNDIVRENGFLRVWVTAAPEGGKANEAVQKLLADALGVAKSRLVLIRGETAREKVWRLD